MRSPCSPTPGAWLYHRAVPAGGAAARAAPGGGIGGQQRAAERKPSPDGDAEPAGAEAGGASGCGAARLQSLPGTPPHPVVGTGTQTKAGGR